MSTLPEKKTHKNPMDDDQAGSQSSLVLSLSLFILLLAFFIILNGLSEYSQPKMDQAFDSLDLAFSTNITPTEMTKTAPDEREKNKDGAGDSLEELQGILSSLLPDLNMQMGATPNDDGNEMVLHLPKAQYEKLSVDLRPLFVRILNQKDRTQTYGLTFVSYVRDPLSENAKISLNIVNQYREALIEDGLVAYRASTEIAKGNPAMLAIRFEPYRGAQ
jgi:hypothetical protein